MKDMSKCVNEDCPIKNSCLRYRAVPDKYQSYTKFYPNSTITPVSCDFFEKILPGHKVEPLIATQEEMNFL